MTLWKSINISSEIFENVDDYLLYKTVALQIHQTPV